MKKKEFNQFKEKSVEELKVVLGNLETEAMKAKLEIAQGKMKNVHTFLTKRKDIAKINTLISEKAPFRPSAALRTSPSTPSTPLRTSSLRATLGAREGK